MKDTDPPLVSVRISQEAIVHNLNTFKDAQGLPVAPVLKSNAYGHGIVETGKIIDAHSPPFACVTSLIEAYTLRGGGVKVPLLVFGYTPLDLIQTCELAEVSFGIISLAELQRLASAEVSAKIHLEIDTGMHRHGIMPAEIDEAIKTIASNPKLTLEGVYSHLADGDTKDSALNARQIETWNAAVGVFRAKCPSVRYFHLSATTGVEYVSAIDANIARLGIGLYGSNASLKALDLRPALEMRTRISSIRTVSKGETVGYNGTYTAPSDQRVATIPAGYMEGVDRRLSNCGSMMVRGKACPILGRVSMNITSLDVTDLPEVELDDEVVVISSNPSDPNSIENIARLCGTIPYEIMVHILSALPRVVV